MTRLNSIIVCVVSVCATLGSAGAIYADEEQPPIKLTLHPRAESTPALKYRLLPSRMDQVPGNAAVHYGKVTAEETRFFGSQEIRDKIEKIQEQPLEQLRGDDVRMPGGGPEDSVQDDIRRGAHCRYCDWQLPIGDVGFYPMPLPDIQQSRQFGRILAAQARIQMAQGDFDPAVETFQAGFALGRHVATGETLVNGLVGIAVASIINHQVQDFVQQPNSPNLYWALADLPTPFIDMTAAIDVERHGVELSFPELGDLERTTRSPDEWRELFHSFAKHVVDWTRTGDDKPEQPSGEELDQACEEVARTEKGVLLEGGMSPKRAHAMPVHQLALMHTLRTHRELLDDGIKYYSLPYPQAIAGIDAAIERAKEAYRDEREILPLSANILGAIRSARSASVRSDREFAVLRVIEALRMHAARQKGQLPEKLSDITEVPIPDDPVTGKPFVYRGNDNVAILKGPTLREVPLNYQITMVQQK